MQLFSRRGVPHYLAFHNGVAEAVFRTALSHCLLSTLPSLLLWLANFSNGCNFIFMPHYPSKRSSKQMIAVKRQEDALLILESSEWKCLMILQKALEVKLLCLQKELAQAKGQFAVSRIRWANWPEIQKTKGLCTWRSTVMTSKQQVFVKH